MNPKSKSQITNKKQWLEKSYENRRKRSFQLGVSAIDMLLKEGKSVSYRSVSNMSKDIDSEGIGIHSNTILKNKELHEYFLKHSNTKKPITNRKPIKLDAESTEQFKHVKIDRDLDKVQQRYMQLTKQELVEILIRAEQYISNQNQRWLKDEFEKYQ
ncbi:hypothetical protein [Paenibacillus cremeus]|uniref:Uncharacterized protein n=1 Tax=Paenibacillus cremeus TaxID=2163881 RepID=A0A559K4P4_9BACL|nr:hypothetical protein [Paenibacillus cremeus]TVY07118.1 hypothetical protein FPZ49_25335 [Paenibacillus cremeus]